MYFHRPAWIHRRHRCQVARPFPRRVEPRRFGAGESLERRTHGAIAPNAIGSSCGSSNIVPIADSTDVGQISDSWNTCGMVGVGPPIGEGLAFSVTAGHREHNGQRRAWRRCGVRPAPRHGDQAPKPAPVRGTVGQTIGSNPPPAARAVGFRPRPRPRFSFVEPSSATASSATASAFGGWAAATSRSIYPGETRRLFHRSMAGGAGQQLPRSSAPLIGTARHPREVGTGLRGCGQPAEQTLRRRSVRRP